MNKKELTAVEPREAGFSADKLKAIHRVNQERVERGEIPGSVTLLVRDGKIAHYESHGYFDIETKKPMTKDTIFRIASATKPVTSVALLMLYEEGRFNLDDPISKFIPAFKDPMVVTHPSPNVTVRHMLMGIPLVPAERDITFRHCLTHTGGFASRRTPVGFAQQYIQAMQGGWDSILMNPANAGKTPPKPMRETIDAVAKIPLNFQPGTDWEYGHGHDICGVLVESISGMTLDEFMKKRIFEPLGMKDSGFFLPEEKADRLAPLYMSSDTPDGNWRISKPPFADQMGQAFIGPKIRFGGGGGLVSTMMDYAIFGQMLLNGGELNGVRLLSRKTVELMTMNHTGNFYINIIGPGYGYGLGVCVSLNPAQSRFATSAGSFGWGGAFATYFIADPKERLVVLYSTQVMGGGGNAMRLPVVLGNELVRLAYQAIID